MYPVSLGYNEAKSRIENLLANGHSAEALVTSTFTVEKTLRRTLRQLVISAGFKPASADSLLKKYRGFEGIGDGWAIFDPKNRKLKDLIGGSDWNTLKNVFKMRNDLVHGAAVYPLTTCGERTKETLRVLDGIVEMLENTYEYSGWRRVSTRKNSTLHSDPKVKIS